MGHSASRSPAGTQVSTMGESVRLCSRTDLSSGEARRFDVGDIRVALVRIEDDFYAIGDRCSHEDFSLAEGEVWPDERELECAKHGSTFDLRTGAPCSLPATKPVPVYDVVVDGDDVLLVTP
jgi:3-phenylpropionate/trans-cinnamate dioxygenase ferredoxin subunit